ncbi:MAG: DUF2203 domain-containing protein [Persicimonas sp.]
MHKRYFTVEEANEMVPFLEQAFTRILQLRHHIGSIYQLLDVVDAAPESEEFDIELPGASPAVIHNRATLKALMETVNEELATVRATGCLVKGVDTGLVDWYARRNGRDVFLCWRLGEDEVRHWHEVSAGVRGRRPIEEFYDASSEADETDAGVEPS